MDSEEGIHQVAGPITGTPDSARAGEILNDRQGRVATILNMGKVLLEGLLAYSQPHFVGDSKEKESIFSVCRPA